MRLKGLFLLDMRFQAKYGFYFLYGILTVIYGILLLSLPENWREKAATLLIFSDPASMGLFFMGAIVLLEKNQHTPWALAVSPVLPEEYILAKVGSLSAISLVVAAVLALVADVKCLYLVLPGTALASVLFTLLGMIAATKIASLNQFILWTVPIEIVCFVPAVLHLFRITPDWLRYAPIHTCMDMVSGRVPTVAGVIGVAAGMAILLAYARICVVKMWEVQGGAKL